MIYEKKICRLCKFETISRKMFRDHLRNKHQLKGKRGRGLRASEAFSMYDLIAHPMKKQ
jgi:hypothetical protein